MKLNVSRQLTQFNGKPLMNQQGEPAILRDYLLVAINHPVDTPEKAVQMRKLGVRIALHDEVTITVSENKILQENLVKTTMTVVAGQIIMLLEEQDPDVDEGNGSNENAKSPNGKEKATVTDT
jgi:hypothetical protein